MIVLAFKPINFNFCNCGNLGKSHDNCRFVRLVQLRSNDRGCLRTIPANIIEFIFVFGETINSGQRLGSQHHSNRKKNNFRNLPSINYDEILTIPVFRYNHTIQKIITAKMTKNW